MERRHAERSRTFLGGTIIFNKGNSQVACQIRNFSSLGAKLILSGAVNLPDEFDVHIPQKHHTFHSRLCWRHEQELGVAFFNPVPSSIVPSSPTTEDLLTYIAQLEEENAALKRRLQALTVELQNARLQDLSPI